MASRQAQHHFQQGPPPPRQGQRYAPGIQGPRPMPQSARGHTGAVFYQGPITPSFQAFDDPSTPTPGAPRRGPAPRGPAFGRQGSDVSIIPAGSKKQKNPKQKNRNAIAPGAIASPVNVFQQFTNALESAPKAPKHFSFHTSTTTGKNPKQDINIRANWGSRSGSISSHASSNGSEDFEDGLIAGAYLGGATVGAMDPEELVELGELFANMPDSRNPSRKNSQAASSDSGSPFELPGGVYIGRRDSMGSSATGQSLTPSASRPHLPFKRVSSIDRLSQPRPDVRNANIARMQQLNDQNRKHKKLLNMGNKPRSTGKANSSKKRQPRVDSFAEGSFAF